MPVWHGFDFTSHQLQDWRGFKCCPLPTLAPLYSGIRDSQRSENKCFLLYFRTLSTFGQVSHLLRSLCRPGAAVRAACTIFTTSLQQTFRASLEGLTKSDYRAMSKRLGWLPKSVCRQGWSPASSNPNCISPFITGSSANMCWTELGCSVPCRVAWPHCGWTSEGCSLGSHGVSHSALQTLARA